MTDLEAKLHEAAQARAPAVAELRHDLHRHPETAFREHRTAGVLAERLRALGLEVRTDLAETAVVALLVGARPGPTVALRADIDALPIREQSAVAYRSEEAGAMHACGHDGHTAILAGAAEVLSSLRQEIAGRILFLFQPAEEPVAGARVLCATGFLREYDVETIAGLHGWTGIPLGSIDVSAGPVMASTDTFDIALAGRGGHAAMPHLAVDPVVAAAHVVTALQSVASREISPVLPVVVSVTSVQAGDAYNVIPEQAHLKGTIRALDAGVRAKAPDCIRRIAAGVAAAYGATATAEFHEGCPVTVNDERVCAAVRAAAVPLLGAANVRAAGEPSMGAEDFSYYAQEVPAAFFRLGLGDVPPLHNPHFDFPDAALLLGVELMCRVGLRLLAGGEDLKRG